MTEPAYAGASRIYHQLAEVEELHPTDATSRRRHELAARAASGRTFLDVGCGSGVHLWPLAGPGRFLVGVDVTEAMIELHRELGEADVKLFLASAEDLPFPDASFEGAACFATLVLVTDFDRALSELHRVVAPGGLVALDLAGSHSLAHRYWRRWYAERGHPHQNAVTWTALRPVLAAHGFDVLEVHPFGATDQWKYLPRLHRWSFLQRLFHGNRDLDERLSRLPCLRNVAARWLVLARRAP